MYLVYGISVSDNIKLSKTELSMCIPCKINVKGDKIVIIVEEYH